MFSWRAQADEEDRLIQHLDFFTFTESISDANVWAALAIVVVLTPIFVWREKGISG